MEWEVQQGNRVSGPLQEHEVIVLVREGRIRVEDKIRPVGKSVWKPLARHPPFASALHAREVEETIDVPPADAAFERLKKELLLGKLADGPAVRAMRFQGGERKTYAACQITHVAVTRHHAWAREPAASIPTTPSASLGPWDVDWPPQSQAELVERTIDVRQTFQVDRCVSCGASGRTRCGVCQGSGRVADPRRPGLGMTCGTCQGGGVLVCGQCHGHGRIVQFPRLHQTVEVKTQRVESPGRLGMPVGRSSGELTLGVPLGFYDAEQALASIRRAAPNIPGDLAGELARAVVVHDTGSASTRVAWLEIRAQWFDGWELTCNAAGKPRRFFVPDTAARFTGPRMTSLKKVGAIVAAAIAAVLLVVSAMVLVVIHRNQQLEAARVAQAERQQAEQEARHRKLRSEVPAAVKRIEAAVASVETLTSIDEMKKKETELLELRRGLDRYSVLQPAPEGLAAGRARLHSAIAEVTKLRETYEAVRKAEQLTERGDAAVASRNWLSADESYAEAMEGWTTNPELMRRIRIPKPGGTSEPVDAKARIAKLETKRKRIAHHVRREKARAEAEERKREAARREEAALRVICGEKPVRSPWDGECIGIERALRRVAHDPDSIDVENCTDPVLTEENCWVTTCDVRGKNALGAKIFARKQFSMSTLGVSEI